MEWYVALLRGINVGGHNSLTMDELSSILEEIGLLNISTYIQSGNVLFQSEASDLHDLARKVSAAIEKAKGFAPNVHIMPFQRFKSAAKDNPFPDAEEEPSRLHLAFMEGVPAEPDLDQLEAVKTENERFELIEDVLYLHAPDGIGRSKLVAKLEKALGVSTTMRNWRTVTKLVGLGPASSP